MGKAERRVDNVDGVAYTWGQLAEYYGEYKANKIWEAAGNREWEEAPKAKPKAKAKVKAKARAKRASPKIKLTYFGIEGVAEKIRLALTLGKVEFEDERIQRPAWEELKPKTKFGQLPMMTVDGGEVLAQSGAMLRYAGKLGGLYPTFPAAVLEIEEVIGLEEDIGRALAPSLYMGMKPQNYGYPEDMPEADRKAVQAKLRAKLVAEDGDLPRMLGYLDAMLEKNGTGWFVGKKPTIADCQVIPRLRVIRKGVQDGIPTDLFDKLTSLKKWYEAFHELPEVKTYYKGEGAP